MIYKSVFFSDVHLGLAETHAAELSDFLTSNQFEHAFMLGDLFDLYVARIHPSWHKSNGRLMQVLFDLAKDKKIIYIPGNHDEALRAYCGSSYAGVRLVEEMTYTSVSGKKFLLCHGDRFDSLVAANANAALSRWGSWFYNVLLYFNPIARKVRWLFGLRKYWSLAAALKTNIRNANYVRAFETAMCVYAKKKGCAGVICGHTHDPKMTEDIDGIAYYNDGDIIGNISLLVEHLNGDFEIVRLQGQINLVKNMNIDTMC